MLERRRAGTVEHEGAGDLTKMLKCIQQIRAELTQRLRKWFYFQCHQFVCWCFCLFIKLSSEFYTTAKGTMRKYT